MIAAWCLAAAVLAIALAALGFISWEGGALYTVAVCGLFGLSKLDEVRDSHESTGWDL